MRPHGPHQPHSTAGAQTVGPSTLFGAGLRGEMSEPLRLAWADVNRGGHAHLGQTTPGRSNSTV